jgi:uncharacterized protein YkwD
MGRINVHRIASGSKKIAAAAICLLMLLSVPEGQLHSQQIEMGPAEQSSPAELSVEGDVQILPFVASTASTSAGAAEMRARSYVPAVLRSGGPAQTTVSPLPDRTDPARYINYFRSAAGLPAVTFSDTLTQNCWLHSRYMAEENELAHSERPDSPWYSTGGQTCGKNGNVWLGSAFSRPVWQPYHAIDNWLASVGHRMWLLYPTTPVFGFSFYTAGNNRAGAALDVLSGINSGNDLSYAGWPVRYPAPNQSGIPPQAYSITLGWRYFGATPTVSSVSLSADGKPIPFTHTTALPVNHKGIEIKPAQPLPANSTITVSVAGSYDGKPFSHTWNFMTGN